MTTPSDSHGSNPQRPGLMAAPQLLPVAASRPVLYQDRRIDIRTIDFFHLKQLLPLPRLPGFVKQEEHHDDSLGRLHNYNPGDRVAAPVQQDKRRASETLDQHPVKRSRVDTSNDIGDPAIDHQPRKNGHDQGTAPSDTLTVLALHHTFCIYDHTLLELPGKSASPDLLDLLDTLRTLEIERSTGDGDVNGDAQQGIPLSVSVLTQASGRSYDMKHLGVYDKSDIDQRQQQLRKDGLPDGTNSIKPGPQGRLILLQHSPSNGTLQAGIQPLDTVSAAIDEPGVRVISRLQLVARQASNVDATAPLLSIHLRTTVEFTRAFAWSWRASTSARTALFELIFGPWDPHRSSGHTDHVPTITIYDSDDDEGNSMEISDDAAGQRDRTDSTATVDLFYRSLLRAPVSKRGKLVQARSRLKLHDQKGRGVHDVEDALLIPPGLEPRLMPFQSRTVRWMLAREGKRVLPVDVQEDDMTGHDSDGAEYRDENLHTRRDRKGKGKARVQDVPVSHGKREDKGKGRARNVDLDLSSDDHASEDEENRVMGNMGVTELTSASGSKSLSRFQAYVNGHDQQGILDSNHDHVDDHADEHGDDDDSTLVDRTCALADLSARELNASRRGPLWTRERFVLPNADVPNADNLDDTAGERREVDLWINRFCSVVSVKDPGDIEVDRAQGATTGAGAGRDENEGSKPIVWSGGNGLLAEEVGLGKTVEVLALILLHQMPERDRLPPYHSDAVASIVHPTHMTLIIAPSAIVGQWRNEIQRHAPSLRVCMYTGIKQLNVQITAKNISNNYDIMLTTYDVLRNEVAIARKPHERSMRRPPEQRRKYRRPLLVQLDFLRVIMDEAQMIGESVSAVSETASLIPRKFSFAVTSTPLKGQMSDVQGLLAFLRVEPFVDCGRTTLGNLMIDTKLFSSLWVELGARTLKEHIEHELVIPEQKRLVVPVEFGPVERYWYDSRYSEMMEQLQLEPDGTPQVVSQEGYHWDPTTRDLNSWLTSLRQACCHPQVGQAAKVVLGRTLKTVEDVLDSMRDKALTSTWNDQRALLAARVKHAQLLCYDREECERFERALEMLQDTLLEVQPIVAAVLKEVKRAWRECKRRKRNRDRRAANEDVADDASDDGLGVRDDEDQDARDGMDVDLDGAQERTGTDAASIQLAETLGLGLDDEADEGPHALKLNEKDKAAIAKLSSLRNRLRELVFVEHNALFFSGSAYYNMGKFPDEEAEMYKRAEHLRQTLLKPYERQVDRARETLRADMERRDALHELDALELEFQFGKHRGLQAQEAFEEAETTIDVLNGYAELLWKWRGMILAMMYTAVTIAGEDATGEEYAERAELQAKLDCYLEAYEVLLQEWRFGLNGEQSALAAQLTADIFAKDKKGQWAAANPNEKRRKKKDYIPLARRRVPTLEAGDTPEEILRFELLVERIEAKGVDQEQTEIVPLKNVIKKLKEAAEAGLNDVEVAILKREQSRLRKETGEKEKIADRFRAELVEMTRAFNTRLSYFKQLQILSDEVADPDLSPVMFKGFSEELAAIETEENELADGIAQKAGSLRYLDGLAAGHAADPDTTCVICSETYVKGVLTTCGHIFCHSCFTNWHARSRTCALCKKELHAGDWEIVNFRRREAVANASHTHNGVEADELDSDDEDVIDPKMLGPAPKLQTIDTEELEAIEAIDTVAPLSSKSDLIVKHVKKIRRDDPLAKVVIFSAWNEALQVLMQAFSRNSVGFVRLEQGSGGAARERIVSSFIEEPSIAAFFLHTKSQSAGLNLTCAQYVFLVEPLLHPSLEIQAVARVHRIGQKSETTVFQYFVADSVDERVAELRARQGTSLFMPANKLDHAREARAGQRDLGSTSLKHRSSNKATGGDEAAEDTDDLIRCLFSPEHYLSLQQSMLPQALRDKSWNKKQAKDRKKQKALRASRLAVPQVQAQAQAGPSRVRGRRRRQAEHAAASAA